MYPSGHIGCRAPSAQCLMPGSCIGGCGFVGLVIDKYPSVVPFTGPTKVENTFEPNDKLIKQLEDLLAEAKSGKLRSIAYTVVRHDDLIQSGSTSTGYVLSPGTSFAVGEGIARLRHHWDRDRDVEETS